MLIKGHYDFRGVVGCQAKMHSSVSNESALVFPVAAPGTNVDLFQNKQGHFHLVILTDATPGTECHGLLSHAHNAQDHHYHYFEMKLVTKLW